MKDEVLPWDKSFYLTLSRTDSKKGMFKGGGDVLNHS